MNLDFSHWHNIFQSPTWYQILVPEWKKIEEYAKTLPEEERNLLKERVYATVQAELEAGYIALGSTGPNQDQERQPVDTIVIHHTSQQHEISWSRLSAMHLMRLYAPRYFHPNEQVDLHHVGDPIYSHHFRDTDQQVFYAHHWLIRADGTQERLLQDTEIGWHAGNWETNCRSVGICLDGDFTHSDPPREMIQSLQSLCASDYKDVPKNRIFGHREINPKTECPGNTFLNSWKATLTI
jgi:hypothetical protein